MLIVKEVIFCALMTTVPMLCEIRSVQSVVLSVYQPLRHFYRHQTMHIVFWRHSSAVRSDSSLLFIFIYTSMLVNLLSHWQFSYSARNLFVTLQTTVGYATLSVVYSILTIIIHKRAAFICSSISYRKYYVCTYLT